MSFTKGVWEVRDDIIEETYEVVSNVDEDGYYDMICEGLDNLENAHLIAAAPEMYEMLASLREDYGLLSAVGKDIDMLLAKARGEV